MFFLGGMKRDDIFTIPLLNCEEGVIFPASADEKALDHLNTHGHLYRFELPNIATLVRETNCDHYSPASRVALGREQQKQLICAMLSGAACGEDVAEHIVCAHEELRCERETGDVLADKLEWHLGFYDGFPVPTITFDTDLEIVRTSLSFREIMHEDGDELPAWFEEFREHARDVFRTGQVSELISLSLDPQHRTVRLFPVRMQHRGELRTYCCGSVYADNWPATGNLVHRL